MHLVHRKDFTLFSNSNCTKCMQVGYAYVDLQELPFDQPIEQWIPIFVIPKLRYKMCKPHIRLLLYKQAQTELAVNTAAPTTVELPPFRVRGLSMQDKDKQSLQKTQYSQASASIMFASVSIIFCKHS